MSKIFINYRREDTAAYAGRLHDNLTEQFGDDSIFMDIDKIEPGEDFAEVIKQKASSVNVALVLIGRNWLTVTDAAGQRRLDDIDDFVRLEIAILLERKIRVIPVLVGGAMMPKVWQLPLSLAMLARCNAIEIRDIGFRQDVDRLIKTLRKIIVDPVARSSHNLSTAIVMTAPVCAALTYAKDKFSDHALDAVAAESFGTAQIAAGDLSVSTIDTVIPNSDIEGDEHDDAMDATVNIADIVRDVLT